MTNASTRRLRCVFDDCVRAMGYLLLVLERTAAHCEDALGTELQKQDDREEDERLAKRCVG